MGWISWLIGFSRLRSAFLLFQFDSWFFRDGRHAVPSARRAPHAAAGHGVGSPRVQQRRQSSSGCRSASTLRGGAVPTTLGAARPRPTAVGVDPARTRRSLSRSLVADVGRIAETRARGTRRGFRLRRPRRQPPSNGVALRVRLESGYTIEGSFRRRRRRPSQRPTTPRRRCVATPPVRRGLRRAFSPPGRRRTPIRRARGVAAHLAERCDGDDA